MSFERKLRDREPTVGNWVSFQDPAIAEISAGLEFDVVVFDLEHTPNTLATVIEQVRAADAAGTDSATLVRVSENDPTEIQRVLETGADGVMAPMIDTAAEARALVEATRYPPEGVRGVGIGRAAEYGRTFPEYVDRANDELVTIAQIETQRGLENVDEIAAVDGIDGLFVGPADLSTALGDVADTESDRFLDAVDRILEAGREADTSVSILALEPSDVERWIDHGFDFVVAGVDLDYVASGSKRAKAAFDDAVADRDG